MAELDAFEESLDTGDDNRRSSGKPRSSRRWIIIGTVVSLLLIVGVAGFFFQTRAGKATKTKASQMANQAMTQEDEKAKEAEKKKKNRKIKYEVLYPQLTQSQAADVTRELSYDNIDFTIQQNGKKLWCFCGWYPYRRSAYEFGDKRCSFWDGTRVPIIG
jgi:flagellar biosynthesis/type III secretory pathway M-ring protein FliF/YscJ